MTPTLLLPSSTTQTLFIDPDIEVVNMESPRNHKKKKKNIRDLISDLQKDSVHKKKIGHNKKDVTKEAKDTPSQQADIGGRANSLLNLENRVKDLAKTGRHKLKENGILGIWFRKDAIERVTKPITADALDRIARNNWVLKYDFKCSISNG